MSIWGPVIAVVLAILVAAGIVMIAWKLTSEKFQRNFENENTEGNDPPV